MFRQPTERFGNHGENQFSYRESKKFKDALKKLENLSGIGTLSKVYILATALGLKPASEFGLIIPSGDRAITSEVLSGLGLFFYEDTEAAELYEEFKTPG